MSEGSEYDGDYFLRGKESGKSLYTDYRWLPNLTKRMVTAIVKHTGIQPAHRVLDYGCARGYTVRAFVELGYDALGYDISQWAIDNADEVAKPRLVCDKRWLDPELAQFDWVIAKDVLEHVKEVDRVIDTLMQMARVGLFIVVPLSHNGKCYDVPDYDKDVTHIHRFPLSRWCSLFMRAGWQVTAQYRLPGVKDNYSHYQTGNGFIVCRRLSD